MWGVGNEHRNLPSLMRLVIIEGLQNYVIRISIAACRDGQGSSLLVANYVAQHAYKYNLKKNLPYQ